MRTLLLEDDSATRMVFRHAIQNAGHEVVDCGTVSRALTILRTTQIDLLIIDLLVGDTNSLGLANYASYAAPDAEIILVTGSGRFASGEVLAEYPSITWILRKPLPAKELLAFVEFADERMAKRVRMHA